MNNLKTIALTLMAAGTILLLAALAFPMGYNEEAVFRDSTQRMQNVRDHGTTQPATTQQAYQEKALAQTDKDAVFLKGEHFLIAGGSTLLLGLILLIIATQTNKGKK